MRNEYNMIVQECFHVLLSLSTVTTAMPVLDSIQVTTVEGMSLSVDLSEGNLEAFPYPSQFQWTKGGTASSNTSRVMYGYPSLVFDSVSRDDLGNYTLSATNSRLDNPQRIIGTGNGVFSLNVLCKLDNLNPINKSASCVIL